MFTKIDIENWNRRRLYDVFTKEEPCYFSVTYNLDITEFLKNVRKNKEKFFPKFLFGFCSILNKHKEFRMAFDEDGELGFYDVIHPCFTVFHEKEEVITLVWTEFNTEYTQFKANYDADMAKYSNKPFEQKELNIKNYFHISALPWLSFSSVTFSRKRQYDDLSPMFTVGKYFEEQGKTKIPIAIHANHATIDGFHLSRLFMELEDFLAKI